MKWNPVFLNWIDLVMLWNNSHIIVIRRALWQRSVHCCHCESSIELITLCFLNRKPKRSIIYTVRLLQQCHCMPRTLHIQTWKKLIYLRFLMRFFSSFCLVCLFVRLEFSLSLIFIITKTNISCEIVSIFFGKSER